MMILATGAQVGIKIVLKIWIGSMRVGSKCGRHHPRFASVTITTQIIDPSVGRGSMFGPQVGQIQIG